MKTFLTYDDLHNMTDDLLWQIKKTDFVPDLIVSVAMWWWFLSYLLTKWLKIKHFESIQVQSYKWQTQSDIVDLTKHIDDDVWKNILIVDDLVDSWKTLKYILDNFYKTAKCVKTATWIYKTRSLIKPDFYVKQFDDERIVFPYEVYE